MVSTLNNKFVIEVSCGHGDAHTLIRLADGSMMSFGDTDHGKLGRTTDPQDRPKEVQGLTGKEVIRIAAGNQVSLLSCLCYSI